MNTLTKYLAASSASLMLVGSMASAQVTYSTLGAWTSAVGPSTDNVIPDPSPNPFVGFGNGSTSVMYGSILYSQDGTLSDGNFYNVGPLFSGDAAVVSSQQQTRGVANILITLPSAVNGLALNFGTFGGSLVNFTLGNGDTFSAGSTGDGYGAGDFVGVTDGTAFSSILVTSVDGVLNVRDVRTPGASVPDVSTFGIDAILGLLVASHGVWYVNRRKVGMAA